MRGIITDAYTGEDELMAIISIIDIALNNVISIAKTILIIIEAFVFQLLIQLMKIPKKTKLITSTWMRYLEFIVQTYGSE